MFRGEAKVNRGTYLFLRLNILVRKWLQDKMFSPCLTMFERKYEKNLQNIFVGKYYTTKIKNKFEILFSFELRRKTTFSTLCKEAVMKIDDRMFLNFCRFFWSLKWKIIDQLIENSANSVFEEWHKFLFLPNEARILYSIFFFKL